MFASNTWAATEETTLPDRLGYGAGPALLGDIHTRGADAWLTEQLHYRGDAALPRPVAQRLQGLTVSRKTGEMLAREYAQDDADLKTCQGEDKTKAQQALNEKYNALPQEAFCRRTLRALYSDHPLQERLTWFWFNQFTVFQWKANLRLWVADYEETAIRPHVLGRFRDLVLASLTHPAMILYLDNAQNAKGAVNENYARELLELHTLGVDGGYAQKDVQELARVLTGIGVDTSGKPLTVRPELAPYVRVSHGFVFNPARHDAGDKVLFGRPFPGSPDFSEIERAVDLLVAQPATARHVSRRLAQHFLGDTPPPALVDHMAQEFLISGGDLSGTLSVLLRSPEFAKAMQVRSKFKDPTDFVYSSIKALYGDAPLANCKPVANWINQLGEPTYAKLTPEGYPLTGAPWQGADQMMKRFDVARAIAGSASALFVPEETVKAMEGDKPRLNDLYKEARLSHSPNVLGAYDMLRPRLGVNTHAVVEKATSLEELGAYLLTSPEFMYR